MLFLRFSENRHQSNIYKPLRTQKIYRRHEKSRKSNSKLMASLLHYPHTAETSDKLAPQTPFPIPGFDQTVKNYSTTLALMIATSSTGTF